MGKDAIALKAKYGIMVIVAIYAVTIVLSIVNERPRRLSRTARNPESFTIFREPARPAVRPETVTHDAQATAIEDNIKALTGARSPFSAERLAEGDRDRGIVDLDRKIQQQPQNAELRLHRASAYMLKGNIEMAVKDMEIASALKPAYLPLLEKVKAAQTQLAGIGRKRLTREEMEIAMRHMPPDKIAKTINILTEGHKSK